MTYGTWLSAAGMQANQYRQEILSNNLANVNTVGFKKDLAVMRSRAVESGSNPNVLRYQNPLLDSMSGGTMVAPTYHRFESGPPIPTGNPLDVAIKGDGFFAVSDGGTVRYTRDGRFTTNANNELLMVANGGRAKVLDEAGAPIHLLPASAGAPEIGADGTIRQGRSVAGKIGTFEFADRNTLRKIGGNLFEATAGGAQPALDTKLAPGTVEGSTVDPVSSLATLIEVTRAYQLNAQMISLQDSATGQAVSRVGRIG